MGGVQRDIGPAGFQNGQQADDESLRPSHRNANQRVRFHAETLQMPGKAIGTFVEFAITQLTVFCDNGNGVRSLGNLLLRIGQQWCYRADNRLLFDSTQAAERVTWQFSRNRNSMPVPRKVSIASSGVFTIGCPLTLKLVFSTIWRPVVSPTARSSA